MTGQQEVKREQSMNLLQESELYQQKFCRIRLLNPPLTLACGSSWRNKH